MKRAFSMIALGVLLLAALALRAAEGGGRRAEFEGVYERWHKALQANRNNLPHPFFFGTNGPPDLVEAVKGIKQNGFGMADFLCEKFAKGKKADERLYPDVLLLEKVTGINLFHAEDKPIIDQDFFKNMTVLTARFKTEWEQGVYRNPSAQIARLCAERLPKEAAGKQINPLDLMALRRYGVYGVPEIINQIRSNNSKHAFAAYLMVTGQAEKYSAYILQPDKEFVTKEEKLKDIKGVAEELAKTGDDGQGTISKIVKAAQ